ncbi:MAG: 3-deoxy-8-phosphooctulonate synthase [Desulfobacteraceae bacterium]|nr:3-deoxy-8-phosphooctulonate synthase [Desulfobacteraceae bacterium]
MQMEHVTINGPEGTFKIGNDFPITFIAGPCVMEGRDFALDTAKKLKKIFSEAGINFIYKSSFDKANRTSISSYRGVGMKEGLNILREVRSTVGVPVVTDVHTPEQAEPVAEVVDMLQTPAFLCRQSDFITAVAATGKPVNIKKGQFAAPWDMENVLTKATSTGNKQIMLCERGTSYGYGNLVVDMRTFPIMAQTGFPVVFDVTHSVQLPGGKGTCSGGQREFVPHLARAGAAVGVAAIFMEVHPNPDKAPCDGPNMLTFEELPKLLASIKTIDAQVKGLS